MYCKNCGNKIENDEKFCGKCGTEIITNEDESVSKPEIKIKFNHILISLFIVFICIILCTTFIIMKIIIKQNTLGNSNFTSKNAAKITTEWNYSENGTITDGNIELHIGDFVNYDEQSNATQIEYVSPKNKNGMGDQVFNLRGYEYGWRVLGIENGQLLLISEDIVGASYGFVEKDDDYDKIYYYLNSLVGYNNAKSELDNICSLFGQGKGASYARSITKEDIKKITKDFDKDGQPTGISKDSVEYELLFKNPTVNSSINDKYKGKLSGCYYWLATTELSNLYGCKNYSIWSIFYGTIWDNIVYTSDNNHSGAIISKYRAGIRPIVYLSKNAKLIQVENNKFDIEI